MSITERLEKLMDQLQQNIYEKEVIFKLSMLAMLGGESIFLLGKPGIAKSLVARRLKHAFKNGTIFDYLMNRFSTPEEIFGPISIEDLQKGVYRRLVDKYLPTAEIVFLDEIWKAGPSIQNTLLTIINEKIFRNAGEDTKVPMKLLISASNELPAEGQGLEALYDRFIIRYIAHGLKDENNFNDMISSVTELDVKVDEDLKITHKEYEKWSREIKKVKIDEKTFDFISKFRKAMYIHTEGEYYISDRRWKKIAHLMKTSAYFNGRDTVDKPDWLIIPYCIWDNEEQEEEYRLIFNAFYLDQLTYEVRHKKKWLREELEQLAKEYEKVSKTIVQKNLYENIFNNLLQGKYYRLFWKDPVNPVCFIAEESFELLQNNNGEPIQVSLYVGEDLVNLKEEVLAVLAYVDDKTLINIDTNEKMLVEIKNAKGLNNGTEEIERRIFEVDEEIQNLSNAFELEKERLLALPCIFFADSYLLAINNAFDSENLKFEE